MAGSPDVQARFVTTRASSMAYQTVAHQRIRAQSRAPSVPRRAPESESSRPDPVSRRANQLCILRISRPEIGAMPRHSSKTGAAALIS